MSKYFEKNKEEKETIFFSEEDERRLIELLRKMFNGSANEIAYYNFRQQNKPLNEAKGLKGFKKYKNDYRRGNEFDCDCCDLAMQIWCLIIKRAKNAKNISYSGRIISYETERGEHVQIETDTMNSLEAPFNNFARGIINSKYKISWGSLYTEGKGICSSQVVENKWTKKEKNVINRDEWLLEYWDEVFSFERGSKDEETYLQYEEFAELIHTFGNFTVGPVGFNFKSPNAKAKYGDKINVFLAGIWKKRGQSQECGEWVQWFQNNQDILFLEDFGKSGDIFSEDSYPDLTDINTVNDLIRKRGIRIAEWLLKEINSREDSM